MYIAFSNARIIEKVDSAGVIIGEWSSIDKAMHSDPVDGWRSGWKDISQRVLCTVYLA